MLSCIRIDEVLVLQGPPQLGALFSMGMLTGKGVASLALLMSGSCCLVAHVFVLNDWAGMSGDLRDPNRMTGGFIAKGIARTEILFLGMALLAAGLLLLIPLGWPTFGIGLAIAGLSALYSAPGYHLKAVPVFSSVLHLTGGILNFLLGYSVFRAVDERGLEISSYFALAFVAGHLTHEARDYDSDLSNGIRTNAVTFGRKATFAAGLVLFTAANVILVVLAARGVVPRVLMLAGLLYFPHLYWSLHALHAGLTFESIRRLQIRYRALYAAIGLLMAVTALSAH
jgi:4-hydroxybenzoate polyprenyltransferase